MSCSKDQTVKVWSLEKQSLLFTIRAHDSAINAVQIKDNTIITGGGEKAIKIWDLSSGNFIQTLNGHTKGIACLHVHGNYLASGSSGLIFN